MRLVSALLLISSLLTAPTLASAMDIPTYEKQRKEAATSPTQMRLRIYLVGIGEGLRLANAALVQRNETPLFCPPDAQQPLSADNYKQLIDASMQGARDMLVRQERSIESVLLEALQDKYRCEAPDRARVPDARPAQDTAPRP
jgi:hypothetical protein